jgi:hypothetical protein
VPACVAVRAVLIERAHEGSQDVHRLIYLAAPGAQAVLTPLGRQSNGDQTFASPRRPHPRRDEVRRQGRLIADLSDRLSIRGRGNPVSLRRT